ncbi:MAG: hypothetical protein KA247_01775 [Bacteroidetes bacterium]|nr:hypothetical protein [Bacteroidota bacterium]
MLILVLLFSSCQKKKADLPNVQRVDNYVPPASEAEIDVTQSYISPSDALSDRSSFAAANFQKDRVKYRGMRNIYYLISQQPRSPLMIVVEYLGGVRADGDTLSTATRMLLYSDNTLLYRKAYPVDFSDAATFSTARTFDHTIVSVSSSKSILYYWFTIENADGSLSTEYHAVAVDKDGVTNELSGDLTRIGSSIATVRFLNENRLKAKVVPNSRYQHLSVDILFTIDWKTCSAVMDVPIDTVFSVSEQPLRYFSSKIKLFSQPENASSFRETNFRRLTQAQMQRVFIPSLFDTNSISRDRLFIQFNKNTSGWIDHETMKFEEIISEN